MSEAKLDFNYFMVSDIPSEDIRATMKGGIREVLFGPSLEGYSYGGTAVIQGEGIDYGLMLGGARLRDSGRVNIARITKESWNLDFLISKQDIVEWLCQKPYPTQERLNDIFIVLFGRFIQCQMRAGFAFVDDIIKHSFEAGNEQAVAKWQAQGRAWLGIPDRALGL
jgi:hypothetical protein